MICVVWHHYLAHVTPSKYSINFDKKFQHAKRKVLRFRYLIKNLGLFLLEENVRNVEVLPKEAAHLVLEFVAYVSKAVFFFLSLCACLART